MSHAAPARLPAIRTGILPNLFALLRVRQWVKNAFVFLSPIFAGDLSNPNVVIAALGVWAAFCLGASASYILNDFADREMDRLHPVKSRRPIAAGLVAPTEALILAAILATSSIGLSILISWRGTAFLAAWLILNVLYTFGLKTVSIADVLVLASGFVLRMLAGGAVSSIFPSRWMFLMTFFLAMLLAIGKRRQELATLPDAVAHRPSIAAYSVETLEQFQVVLIGLVLASFSMFAMSDYAARRYGTDALIYTIPFVVYGLFRYLHLVKDVGKGADPSELILHDRPLQIAVAIWLCVSAGIIYIAPLAHLAP